MAEDGPGVAQCSEGYVVPGPFGQVNEDGVEPHADVFGVPEFIGAEGTSATVGPDPRHVHLGWPGQDTSTSISFVWMTDSGTLASVVEWGEGDALDQRTEGVSYRFGGTTQDRYRVHELKLCGRLTPDTSYSYRVGGEGHWSPVHQFRTPPAPGTFDTFKVAISGDSRGAYEDWANLVARMEAHDPDFYLFSGDAVQAGGSMEEWDAWFAAAGDTFARKVLLPAHGNHEFLATAWFALFSLPNNEQWYSVDYGSLSVATLNDTVADASFIDVDQTAFLRDVMGESAAPWKFANHHRATWSTCTNHGSAEDLRETWEPVFDEVGMDVVVAGHNHIYERSVPIRGGVEQPLGAGAIYLVSGGAGARLYPQTEAAWFNQVAAPTEHYIIAEFSANELTMTAYDPSDTVIDTVTVPRE